MHRPIKPDNLAPPPAKYAHAILTTNTTQWLHTSGVVARRADGSVPDTLDEQATEIWASLNSMLADAGMTTSDIVAVTTFVVVGNDLATVMAARDAALGPHRAASTLVPVPALARPEWKMEIALIASR